MLHMSCGSHQFLRAKPHGSMTLGQLQTLPEPKGEHQMLALSGRCGKCQRRRWLGLFLFIFFFNSVGLVVVTRPCGTPHWRHLIHKHGGRARGCCGRQQERRRSHCLLIISRRDVLCFRVMPKLAQNEIKKRGGAAEGVAGGDKSMSQRGEKNHFV